MSNFSNRTAIVTGANRGIGKAFVEELLAAGVQKIYACARDSETLNDLVANANGKVIPVTLDITNLDMVQTVAADCNDVNLVINNAGVAMFKGLLAAEDSVASRHEMEVNYFGTLSMVRAFAPHLAVNGGGEIINMCSILGLVNFPILGSYCAAKSAVHSLTQGIRAELAAQGTFVAGVYPGPVDTDMGAHFPMKKATPNSVAQAALEGLEARLEEIFPDETSINLHSGLVSNPKAVIERASKMLPE